MCFEKPAIFSNKDYKDADILGKVLTIMWRPGECTSDSVSPSVTFLYCHEPEKNAFVFSNEALSHWHGPSACFVYRILDMIVYDNDDKHSDKLYSFYNPVFKIFFLIAILIGKLFMTMLPTMPYIQVPVVS